MILSNVDIKKALKEGKIKISPPPQEKHIFPRFKIGYGI